MRPLDVHIEGRHVEILPEWREKIEEELVRLQKHYLNPILHVRAEIIGTGHHRHGAFEIHLVAAVPGNTLIITRQGEFVLPMIVEALDALDRRLEEHSHIQQQQVKVHEEHSQPGTVVRVFPDQDFGFIETLDGLEVYFHAHAVKKGNFKKMAPGERVVFAMEEGEKGPQATWVRPLE
jgi:cold shock CspA family protein/ribosome-associated translation inhibitor RaiA